MLRLLALQDESIFRQIARHPERLRMLEAKKPVVLLSVLDPTQGIILDSAPARLTPDIASRSAQRLAFCFINKVACAWRYGSGGSTLDIIHPRDRQDIS